MSTLPPSFEKYAGKACINKLIAMLSFDLIFIAEYGIINI